MQQVTTLVIATLSLLGAGCKKASPPAGETQGSAAGSATAGSSAGSGSATAAGSASGSGAPAVAAQAGLVAQLAGKPLGPLYGAAQADPGSGNAYELLFLATPVTCATLKDELRKERDTNRVIRLHVAETLRSEGTLAFAYRGISYAIGSASSPANVTPLPAFAVAGGQVTGTLPAGVEHVDPSGSKLTVTGTFAVPVCDPLRPAPYFDVATNTEAVPVPVTGSTATVTVAGKGFAVGGATAMPVAPGSKELVVRLSAAPHGCSSDVPGDLVVALEVGGDSPDIDLRGHWFDGARSVDRGPDLKVTAEVKADTVELTLDGTMEYKPADEAYTIGLAGKVTATICKMPSP